MTQVCSVDIDSTHHALATLATLSSRTVTTIDGNSDVTLKSLFTISKLCINQKIYTVDNVS